MNIWSTMNDHLATVHCRVAVSPLCSLPQDTYKMLAREDQRQQMKNNLTIWGRQQDSSKKLRVHRRLPTRMYLWNILHLVRNKIGRGPHLCRVHVMSMTTYNYFCVGCVLRDGCRGWQDRSLPLRVLDCADLFLVTFTTRTFRKSIRDGLNFFCQCQKFHRMIIWKVCTTWDFESPRNPKPYCNWTTWKFIRRYRIPVVRDWKTMVKRRIDQKTPNAKFWRQTWENRNKCCGQGSQGSKWRWKRMWYLLPVERKTPVFARRPIQFPPRYARSCAKNQNTLPPRLLSQPCHEVEEVCRGKEVSEATKSNHGSILRQQCRYFLEGTCTWPLCEYWHPPGQRSSRTTLRKIGVYLHQPLNLRSENLLSNPVRQCSWSAKRTWVMLEWILWRNRAVLR